MEYPLAEPFTKDHGRAASATLTEAAKTARKTTNKTRNPIPSTPCIRLRRRPRHIPSPFVHFGSAVRAHPSTKQRLRPEHRLPAGRHRRDAARAMHTLHV